MKKLVMKLTTLSFELGSLLGVALWVKNLNLMVWK